MTKWKNEREYEKLKTKKSKLSKALAACLAAIMAFGGAAESACAEDFFEKDITPVEINSTTFPDPVFRDYVSQAFDTDHNGTLSGQEIGYARNIHVEDMGVTDLTGMEYLVELRGLYCQNSTAANQRNRITSLNISKNQEIKGIWCSNNPIGEIDITQNPTLEWIYCFNCDLTELDLTKSPLMSYVECNDNDLGELDVSQNPLLEHLICNYCELEKLDLSENHNLQHLDAIGNKFTSLDLSPCPKMKRLDIWDMPQLGYVDITSLKGLQYFNCARTGINKLDVSFLPHLQKLICSYNSIQELDLSNNHELNCLYCETNTMKKIDISGCPQLRYFQAGHNNFESVDIGGCPYLVKTYTEAPRMDEYTDYPDGRLYVGYSWTIDYGGDDSTGGDSKFYIWLSDDTKITMNNKAQFPTDERYSPLDSGVSESELMTREQAVQYLYELAGKPRVSGKSRFTDVKEGSWYENAVIWGEDNAMCMGYPYFLADEFGVGKWLTRQDLMFMLMRYSEYMGYERAIDFGRSDDYIDYYDIDYDHWEAVCWCATWHILEGKGEEGAPKTEQYFDPYGIVTRDDFKLAILNMYDKNKLSQNIPDVPKQHEVSTAPAPTSDKLGDVNGDGRIDIEDAVMVINQINGQKALSNSEAKRANVDRNDKIDIEDAVAIIGHVNGIKVIS